jgi:hypothetical protein
MRSPLYITRNKRELIQRGLQILQAFAGNNIWLGQIGRNAPLSGRYTADVLLDTLP